MTDKLKYLILILVIIVPITIFLFIKIFGTNEYNVPVFHTEVSSETIKDCGINGGAFKVPEELLKKNGIKDYSEKIVIIGLMPESNKSRERTFINQVNRLKDQMPEEILLYIIFTEDEIEYELLFKEDITLIKAGEQEIKNFTKCGLMFQEQFDVNVNYEGIVTLIDPERRIRGYYKGSDFEEIDRLLVETRILESNYD